MGCLAQMKLVLDPDWVAANALLCWDSAKSAEEAE
jgi:hypothetical protein